jgi:hypothetical protein
MRRNPSRCEVAPRTPPRLEDNSNAGRSRPAIARSRACLRPLGEARRLFRAGRRRMLRELGPDASDLFEGLPWETVAAATLPLMTTAVTAATTTMGETEHELAAILRRALMDLAIALQEIERQLTSFAPDDDQTPSAVRVTTRG